jgi:signal transduction histidine kinase
MDPLLDTAPCGFLTVSDDGRVLAANATLGEMLATKTAQLIDRHVDSFFTAPSRIFYQTHVFPTLKLQGRVHEVYVTMRDSAGDDVPVMFNAVRKPREDRHVSDWVVMPMRQRDEYENLILQARKAAEAAIDAKDEFLSVVSHEMRSPLDAISGWLRVLQRSQEPAEIARAIEAIDRSVAHQAKLVNDILDFGRMKTGKLRIDSRPMELAPMIEASLDSVLPAAQAKSIVIDPLFEAKRAMVMGDPDRLQQVVWNMLSNAVKFTPKGGRVQVRLARTDSSYEIAVADTGRGIAPEFLPRVFDTFRQEAAEGPRGSGLGLGMAIASQLVELHGGTIRAASEGPGQGATFTVRLPAIP